MKKIAYFIAFLGLFVANSSNAQKGKPPVTVSKPPMAVNIPLDRSKAPAAGPAPKIQIGDYKKFTLDNGMTVIVVENHKLPRVSYSISFDVDPTLEGSKAGVASLMGELLTAGTTKMTKAEIDEKIDFMGANISSSADGIFGSCLTKHSADFLSLYFDILLNPSFTAEELEKAKKQHVSALANEKTDPNSLSDKIASVMNYGKKHPYGEFESEVSIKSITRDDLVAHYKHAFNPSAAYFVIVGDITAEQAQKQAEAISEDWNMGAIKNVDYSVPALPNGNKVIFVPLAGAVQSVINVTYPIDLKPCTDNAIVASVLNNVLGGNGFQTRLMQNLRESKAYTYGAYSHITPDKLMGSFGAEASVRSEVTEDAVKQILFEMDRLTTEAVPDSTLQTVKNIMSGGFARSLERPQTIGNFATNIEKYGLEATYYQNYLTRINSVTAADLQNFAKKYMHSKNAYITIVGNKDIAEKLSGLSSGGRVYFYTAEGEPIVEAKPIPAGVTTETIFANYINAIGGEKNLSKIKSFEETGTMAAGPMNLDMSLKMKDKKMIAMSIKMGGQEVMKQVYDGTKGVAVQMGQKTPMDEQDLKDVRMQTDLMAELHYAQYGITPTLKGIENIDGTDLYAIELKHQDGKTSTEYYNIATGLKARSISVEMDGDKSIVSETIIRDYMTLENGVKFPSAISQAAGPQRMEMTFKEIKLNPKLNKKDFVVE